MKPGMAVTLALLTGALAMPDDAEAQRNRRQQEEPAGHFDISFMAADPVGELALFFDDGFGAQISGAIPVGDDGIVRIRGDLGFIVYGLERQHHCFNLPFGCRLQGRVTTSNNYAYGGIGPEIVLARGSVEPYVFGTVGFASYFTTSSLGDEHGHDDSFTTTHLSDFMTAWRAGGGIRVRVSGGRKPVSLDFGVERHENGIAEFLTKGDIVDHANGNISIYPNVAEANLVTFRVGISIGIPGSRRGR